MPLNKRFLRTVVFKQAEPILRRKVAEIAELQFDVKKEQFLEAFDEHPVTKELEAGPEALSHIPELAQAEGNLYSFLGFEEGEEPAGKLREYLDENTKLGRTGKGAITGDKITFRTPVTFPTVESTNQAMQEEAPLEWTSRSFTEMISSRIPGLPNYLFRLAPRLKSSRSGTAIQTHGKALRGGSFKGTPYVGQLITYFKRLLASPRSRG